MITGKNVSKARSGENPTDYKVVAVSVTEMSKYGCPYCGYRLGRTLLAGGGTSFWICGECDKQCRVLEKGYVKSIDKPAIKLQPHPRKGIPAHGRSDKRPEGGGEFFHPRCIGSDQGTCFVCSTDHIGKKRPTYLHNFAAFVQCKEAGNRVIEMFGYGAWFDFREHEPGHLQVKVCACNRHLKNLEELHRLTTKDGVITQEMIAKARAIG